VKLPQSVLIILVFASFFRFARADEQLIASPPRTELKSLGTTYNWAQSADWLGESRFVVGRWDGTLTVFRPKSAADEFGPVLVDSLATPSRQGIQLVGKITEGVFISSNDAKSLVVWKSGRSGYEGDIKEYDSKYGVAVSSATVWAKGGQLLALGHSEGYVQFGRSRPTDSILSELGRFARQTLSSRISECGTCVASPAITTKRLLQFPKTVTFVSLESLMGKY